MPESWKQAPEFIPDIPIGSSITWMAANGMVSGRIIKHLSSGYLVVLENGKNSIVRNESIIGKSFSQSNDSEKLKFEKTR